MKLDMHIHSWYSYHPFWGHDCYARPREIVKQAIKAGLQGLALTDHNTLKGVPIIKKAAKRIDKNFLIVPAMEIKSLRGDILAYGVSREIPPGLSPEETIERIFQQGGMPAIAHPFCGFWLSRLNKSRWKESRIEALSKRFKPLGIEVFNAGNPRSGNERAYTLARLLNAPMTAGSDSHILNTIGAAGIECDSDPLEALRKGKARPFGEYNPRLTFFRVYAIKLRKMFFK